MKRVPRARFGRWRHESSLHRRIFLWFGVAIVLSALATLTAVAVVSDHFEPWSATTERVRTFTAKRFAIVWNDAAARDELARSIASDLGAGVELRDSAGRIIASHGPECPHRVLETAVLGEGGRPLGSVRTCWPLPNHPRSVGVIALLAAILTLWAISGLLARKLVRPLRELTSVTRDLGEGKLGRRADLAPHEAGEVGVLAKSINEMAVRIERQLADQRELLAAVSHEVRTPLGHLRVLTELLRDSGADDKLVGDIEREVHDIDDLMGRLLASSRLDFSAVDLRPLDPVDLARRAIERAELAPDVLVDGVTGHQSGPDAATVPGDPTLLARALANLLANAVVHGGGVDRVRVAWGADRAELIFTVEDRGPGLSSEALGKAFDSFYRSRGSSDGEPAVRERSTNGGGAADRHTASLGLGLSLVDRIANAHGGRAWAENRVGGGARVSFSVRCARQATSEVATAPR